MAKQIKYLNCRLTRESVVRLLEATLVPSKKGGFHAENRLLRTQLPTKNIKKASLPGEWGSPSRLAGVRLCNTCLIMLHFLNTVGLLKDHLSDPPAHSRKVLRDAATPTSTLSVASFSRSRTTVPSGVYVLAPEGAPLPLPIPVASSLFWNLSSGPVRRSAALKPIAKLNSRSAVVISKQRANQARDQENDLRTGTETQTS